MKANILVAYPYMKKPMIDLLKENEHRTRFLLDSGAFTAWKAGKPIALDDYCRFIESLPFEPWRYFMLDVIGDPKATLRNYETMLKRGFKPIPIFTRGEDPSVLEDYYKTSDVVAIGGLVGTKGNKGFVKGIMEKVGTRKVHWLGFTNNLFIKAFKPYTVDSSSVWGAGRYGNALLYLGGGKMTTVNRKQIITGQAKKYQKLIETCGVKYEDLKHKEAWINTGQSHKITSDILDKQMKVSVVSQVRSARDVEKHIGTKVFTACNSVWTINYTLFAYQFTEAP